MEDVAEVAGRRCLLGETEAGKCIYLMRIPNAPLRTIAFGSGGKLPEELLGGFSSIKMAKQAVDDYLAAAKLTKKSSGRQNKKK